MEPSHHPTARIAHPHLPEFESLPNRFGGPLQTGRNWLEAKGRPVGRRNTGHTELDSPRSSRRRKEPYGNQKPNMIATEAALKNIAEEIQTHRRRFKNVDRRIGFSITV